MSSPRLPQEISDYIIDLLRDKLTTLGRCCLVSKSWIHPTRKHLFAEITFRTPHDIKVWKQVFPDPADSPARYARSMRIDSMQVVIMVISEGDGWIRAFCNVVELELRDGTRNLYFHYLQQLLTCDRTSPHSLYDVFIPTTPGLLLHFLPAYSRGPANMVLQGERSRRLYEDSTSSFESPPSVDWNSQDS